MNTDKLKEHLFFFTDAFTHEEELIYLLNLRIERGFSQEIISSIKYIDWIATSNPDREELRRFVAYEMNRDFGDPTGEADLQWLISARDLMQSVLDETEKKPSS